MSGTVRIRLCCAGVDAMTLTDKPAREYTHCRFLNFERNETYSPRVENDSYKQMALMLESSAANYCNTIGLKYVSIH